MSLIQFAILTFIIGVWLNNDENLVKKDAKINLSLFFRPKNTQNTHDRVLITTTTNRKLEAESKSDEGKHSNQDKNEKNSDKKTNENHDADALSDLNQVNLQEHGGEHHNPDQTHHEGHNEGHHEEPHKEPHQEGHHEEHHEEHHHHEHHVPAEGLGVFFCFGGLLLGCICREIKKATGIPYTPMQLQIGMIVGWKANSLGDFGKSMNLIMEIDPHGILMIFVPTILFESAFNADNYIFKKELGQAIILAGPGVIIGAGLLACCWNFILGYASEFSFAAAMTFASITCATDPVAVVALLKELGTPIKFNLLQEGESLLNDGTAMVFYLVFASIYKAQGVTIGGIIIQFVQLSIGGPVFGALACYFIIFWQRRIVKDELLTISITFFACYLTFFFGEAYLGVSGILAIVTLGVLMGSYGRVQINPESEHAVHACWSFIQFTLETLIFILTGAIIGKTFLDERGESTIVWEDWIRMILFYFLMTISRFIMVSLLFPVLNTTGYPVTRKDTLILTYGGLRGAIALALALMVSVDFDFPKRFRDLVLFYVVGMITLTVLFNGQTIKWVMDKVNFKIKNPWKEKIKLNLVKNMLVASFEHEESIRNSKFLKLCDWTAVNDISGITQMSRDYSGTVDPLKEYQEQKPLGGDQDYAAMNSEDGLIETRLRFYKLQKAQIWERFEESICGGDIVRNVNEKIDICMDELERKIWIWDAINHEIYSIERLQSLLGWKDFPLIGRYIRHIVLTHLLETYESLYALHKSLHELIENKPSIPLSQNYVNEVFKEITINKNKVEKYLYKLMDLYPELIRCIQNKQAAHMLLNEQKLMVKNFEQTGAINEEETDELQADLDKKINQLDYINLDWEFVKIDSFAMFAPIFSKLPESLNTLAKDNISEVKFNEGTHIFNQGNDASCIYIISKGQVEDQLSQDFSIRSGMGTIQSFANLINHQKALSDVVAIEETHAYMIPGHIIMRIAEENSEFEEEMYKDALFAFLKSNPMTKLHDEESINRVTSKAMLRTYEMNNQLVTLENGGFMFSGEIRMNDENLNVNVPMFDEPTLIKPMRMDYITNSKTKILKFSEPIEAGDNTGMDRMSITKKSMQKHLSAGSAGGMGRASFKNSILVTIQQEKDIDKLFLTLVGKKFGNFVNQNK